MKFLSFLLSVMLLAAWLPVPAAAEGDQPELVVTYAPGYNVDEPFRGYVRGISDPAAYRVTLYLQVNPGESWWVKPTTAQPAVPLDADGSFVLDYTSGVNDLVASSLYLMVIPADYTPTTNGLSGARAAALDTVLVTRARGSLAVEPDRYYTGKHLSCAPGAGRLLVDVGFYTSGRPGQGLSASLINAQLDALSGIASGVRLYAASGELYPAYQLARSRGLTVFGTANLTGNAAADRAEMDALIEHCNSGRCQAAIVGNEVLLSGRMTLDALLDCIAYVRAGITNPAIPVTTSDSAGFFINNPRLMDAVDIVMPNIYPYWEGVDSAGAANHFIGNANAVRRIARGKQVIISETGWPTLDPAGADAADYFETLWAWSLSGGVPILWFEGADEPWKSGDEGTAGAHWGFFTRELELKEGYAALGFFQSAAAGITPRVVSFDAGGGKGSTHPRGTGADHLLTLPECGFTAPEGMVFGGWLAGDRLYQPGETAVFEANATVTAFWLPGGEETAILPAGLEEIRESAFEHSGLRYAVVPGSCGSIGARAFADCGELLAVFVPGNVTAIGPEAFDNSPLAVIMTPAGSFAAQWAEANGVRYGSPAAVMP